MREGKRGGLFLPEPQGHRLTAPHRHFLKGVATRDDVAAGNSQSCREAGLQWAEAAEGALRGFQIQVCADKQGKTRAANSLPGSV